VLQFVRHWIRCFCSSISCWKRRRTGSFHGRCSLVCFNLSYFGPPKGLLGLNLKKFLPCSEHRSLCVWPRVGHDSTPVCDLDISSQHTPVYSSWNISRLIFLCKDYTGDTLWLNTSRNVHRPDGVCDVEYTPSLDQRHALKYPLRCLDPAKGVIGDSNIICKIFMWRYAADVRKAAWAN